MKILAIIPARSGSKGVPDKNKKLLDGLPLVVYSIRSAIQCSAIDHVMVSTESEEISDIAIKAGAEVPSLRPKELATDHSPTIDTVIHVLKEYLDSGEEVDAVCLLQPTVPFRHEEDLKNAILKFKDDNADTLISMRKVPKKFHPSWVYEEVSDGQVRLLNGKHEPVSRRQDLEDLWYRDGAIYISKSKVILEKQSLYGEHLIHFEMENSPNINIDTMEDWLIAEQYQRRRNA